MCFPFLLRAALDARATEINEPMKLACAKSLANLARLPVPDMVKRAYNGADNVNLSVIKEMRLIHMLF